MNRIIAFDSMRFILCIFIILHHIGINIYRFHGLENPYFRTAHLAVECFFILSGFLIAKHFFKRNIIAGNEGQESAKFFFSRIKRLYPEYLFALLICSLLTNLFSHHISMKTFLLNLTMLAGWGNVPNIINGIWYVTILFWGGCFLYFLLVFFKDKARFIFIPIIALLSLFCLINQHGCISGHQQPILYKLLSLGTVRGLLGLCCGFFVFEICRLIQNSEIKFNEKIINPLVHIVEVLCFCQIIRYCLFFKHNSIADFNIYYYMGILTGILYFRKEYFLKFLSWKGWEKVAYLSYTIYLTHLILIEILRVKWKDLSFMSPWISYSIIIILCIIFAMMCYHTQKYLFSKLIKYLVKQ